MSKKKSGNNIQKNTSSKEPKTAGSKEPKTTSSKEQKNTSQKEKKNEIKYEAQPDVKLTAYTAVAMIAIVVSAVATVLGAVLLAKPFYYGMRMVYGDNLDVTFAEVLSEVLFTGGVRKSISILLTVAVVLAAISAVVSIVITVRAMAPEKKPMVALSWGAFVFSAAALILVCIGTKILYDNSSFAQIEKNISFEIYIGAIVGYGVNVIAMIANIIGNYMGLSRFKKDGRAY